MTPPTELSSDSTCNSAFHTLESFDECASETALGSKFLDNIERNISRRDNIGSVEENVRLPYKYQDSQPEKIVPNNIQFYLSRYCELARDFKKDLQNFKKMVAELERKRSEKESKLHRKEKLFMDIGRKEFNGETAKKEAITAEFGAREIIGHNIVELETRTAEFGNLDILETPEK